MAFNPLNPIDLLSDLDKDMMRDPRAWVQHFAAPELQAIPQQQPVDESAFLPQGFTQPGSGVLDALALGISQGGLPQAPRGFGGAFLSGAARGFAGARGADITRRTRQLEKARESAAAENKRNLELTDALKEANRAAVSNAARKLRDFQLKRLEDARKQAAELAAPEKPSEIRAERRMQLLEDSARRAEDAARLAGQKFDRQIRLENVRNLTELVNQYQKDPAIDAYNDVRRYLAVGKAGADQNSGVGDLSLIFAYVRSNEQGNASVVREGEVKTAAEAIGKLEQTKSILPSLFKGDKFTPEGRRRVISQIEASLGSLENEYEMAQEQFKRRAAFMGVDPDLFMREFPKDSRPPISEFDR